MKKIFNIILLGSLVLFNVGCDDALVTEPRQSVSAEVALTDITGVRSLIISGYDRLQGAGYYGQQMILGAETLADNATVTNAQSNRYLTWSINNFGTHFGIWANAYAGINEMNFIINADLNSITTTAEANQLRGEALFLRALMYFDLARVYGYEPGREVNGFQESVIIREQPTSTSSQADFRPRSSNQEVYAIIERDLNEAIPLLTGTNRFRVTTGAARALLSRVYLYQSKWQQAEEMATSALANTAATMVDASVNPAAYRLSFASAPHPESVFELAYNAQTETLGFNESLNSLTLRQGGPVAGSGGWGDVIPTQDLLSIFLPEDSRIENFISDVKQGQTALFSRKYAGTVGPFTDNVPLIRLSELYLIRAEARVRQGGAKLVEGLADLNFLRSRRFPSTFAFQVVTTNQQEAIDAIFTERRLELFFEGHRFFDLKRTGQDIRKGATGAVQFSDTRVLAPLPQAQVDLNPLLNQNPGY
ncbi:RagB/SusD family nutrient uptake outer membrane protein [Belliella pelovolcani]|uniref:SusD family protein n=1 Tax=Belliella pelovolcani TaxID=529505 RepID=A0A1N7MZA4_9BACT|nr:RagB/SusD family nutrient uptake outer membrane protein [Belliella pelovolcani]SIS91348.1 SusD family protein [Belliella pelovolcani]